jgi:hypothetical protein
MITAIEKLIYVETEIAHRKGVWADTKLAVFEAIAADYRKQATADQLEADITDEASKVTGYIEWKDAQDAVQQTAD